MFSHHCLDLDAVELYFNFFWFVYLFVFRRTEMFCFFLGKNLQRLRSLVYTMSELRTPDSWSVL